jgi:hypothetical protein
MTFHTECAVAVFLPKRHFLLLTSFFFTGWLFDRLPFFKYFTDFLLVQLLKYTGGNYLTFSTYSFSLCCLPSESGDIFFRTSAV